MSKKILKYSLFFVVYSLSVISPIYSQTKEFDSLEVIVIGKYKAMITDANKRSENPVIVDSTKKLKVNGYNINSKKVPTSFDVDSIEAAQMVGEPLTKLYKGLVKLGMGNYTTPYAELWFNNLRSKEYSYGLRLKTLSSQSTINGYGFGGFSDNNIGLYGKKFLKEHILSGDFDYKREVVHFYGYDKEVYDVITKDSTRQRFNYFGANAELKSQYSNPKRYHHDVKMNFYNLHDNYKTSESNFKANAFVQTTIDKELLNVNAAVDYYNYRAVGDTVNNTIITMNPNFIAKGEAFRATMGVTGVIDVMDNTSKFYFYPNIDFSYNILDNIIVPYAGVLGKLQKNSFKSFTDANPFVSSSLAMENSNHRYEIYGGLKGTLSSTVAYTTRVSVSQINDMALFVNNRTDVLQNRFDVIYDDAKLFSISGEVSYQQREKLRINLSGKYSNYTMTKEQKAWYTPKLVFKLAANYNLRDKIVAKIELNYLGEQYAKAYVPIVPMGEKVVPQQLKGVVDANIGAEYRYTKKLGFFLNLNNITNFRYYRYSNYPTQRFGIMAGLSYSF